MGLVGRLQKKVVASIIVQFGSSFCTVSCYQPFLLLVPFIFNEAVGRVKHESVICFSAAV